MMTAESDLTAPHLANCPSPSPHPEAFAQATARLSCFPSDMIVSREFVSIGVNRVVNSLAWGGGDGDGLIAYGGHNSVVIYDPEAAVIESTLTGHTGLVNTVLWVEGGGECHTATLCSACSYCAHGQASPVRADHTEQSAFQCN